MWLWSCLLLVCLPLCLSQDGSLGAAEDEPQLGALRRPPDGGESGVGLGKEPSPLHFPPRPPKLPHSLAPLPTALTNGRDLHVSANAGSALNFGSSQAVEGDDVIAPGDSGSAGGGGGSGGGQAAGGGGSGGGQAAGGGFRSRTAPACNNGSLALPCEADAEYTSEIAERVRTLIYASRLNDIIEDETLSQILNDTAVVEPGKDFGIPSTRTGGYVVESPACRAQESIIYPQRAKTATDDWVFVVNQDSVKQGVRVEKCLREGEQCHLGADLPPTVRTTCRQKFIYRKLLVLGDTGTSIQPESVLLPSCCVCYIRQLDQLISGRIFNRSSAVTAPPPPPPVQPINFNANN